MLRGSSSKNNEKCTKFDMLRRVGSGARFGVAAARGISYAAPVRDISFVLYDVLRADQVYKERGVAVDRELMDGLITECARFSETVLAPLNVVGDKEGWKEKRRLVLFVADCLHKRSEARSRHQHGHDADGL